MKSLVFWTVVTVGVVGLGVLGVVPRLRRHDAMARTQAEVNAPRSVRVAKVKQGSRTVELVLPGTSSPYYSTALYAKSVGFLRRNLVDVGDVVKRGQLLGEVAAPETDDEVNLARAQLEEATANLSLSKRVAERNSQLAGAGVVSQETADQTQAQANSAAASQKTRSATLQRVSTLSGYQRLVAPFDGVVTRRNFDPGALVGAAGMGGGAVFEVAQVQTLRVFVEVPQSMANGVKAGVPVTVYDPRQPSRTVAGQVIRTSGVLDASTRTLRTEIHIPGDGTVLPNSFIYARFAIPRTEADAPLSIPGNALVVRKEGTLVAQVVPAATGHKVVLTAVQVGRDLGKEVEVIPGLLIHANDLVVVNPPDDFLDGEPVRIAPEPAPAAAPTGKAHAEK